MGNRRPPAKHALQNAAAAPASSASAELHIGDRLRSQFMALNPVATCGSRRVQEA